MVLSRLYKMLWTVSENDTSLVLYTLMFNDKIIILLSLKSRCWQSSCPSEDPKKNPCLFPSMDSSFLKLWSLVCDTYLHINRPSLNLCLCYMFYSSNRSVLLLQKPYQIQWDNLSTPRYLIYYIFRAPF